MTDVKVVDASALGAVLFDEPEADTITERLRHCELAAPTLLKFEVSNTCLKKILRHPDQRNAMLVGFSMLWHYPIEFVEIDHASALGLAETTGLTFYDASYLWLARQLRAELVTLDKQLSDAWSVKP